MKLKNHLGRLLLLVGLALLAFCALAKLHGFLLSRAAIQHFEDLKQTKPDLGTREAPSVQPLALTPNFASWSEQRVKHYEESLSEQLAPPLAVLRISRIDVEVPVLDGTDDITLNRGVGHIAGTARLGEDGNVGIAGHRDGFFRGLRKIRLGDRIELEEPDRTETYIVDQLKIVSPEDVSVLHPSAKPTLTLVTCYPFYYIGRAPQRFIVHAVLVPQPGNAS